MSIHQSFKKKREVKKIKAHQGQRSAAERKKKNRRANLARLATEAQSASITIPQLITEKIKQAEKAARNFTSSSLSFDASSYYRYRW